LSIALSEFISSLAESTIVRPNRFLCMVTPPEGMINTDLDDYSIHFFVQSATIPDRTFGEIEMKYYGMTFKVPGNETVSTLTINVINEVKWKIRDFFEAWAKNINNRDANTKGFMYDLFTGASVEVFQLDGVGNKIARYKFYHIYPMTVSEMELNMETTDSNETFQVIFSYSYWEQLEIDND